MKTQLNHQKCFCNRYIQHYISHQQKLRAKFRAFFADIQSMFWSILSGFVSNKFKCVLLSLQNKMHLKPNPQDNGVITKAFLKKLCRTDFKQYYSTPQLNDILYLHYKSFEKIDNLEQFTGLKCIYLEGNAIRKIEGLQKLTNLRCLYLQENLITSIEGLDTLTELANLNLSDNMIQKVTGLEKLTKLSNLQLKRNRIGLDGLQDVTGLLQCPSISALDISDNKIEDEAFLTEVLIKLPNIAVVYMQNNGFTKKISHYRKAIISKIPSIKYIDDKPVFEDEHRYAMAWSRGGLEEERKERAKYKQQKEDEQKRQHQQFRNMLERARAQGKKEKERAQSSESDSQVRSGGQSLQTYQSPSISNQNSEKSSEKVESASEKEPSQKENSVSEPRSQTPSENGQPEGKFSSNLDQLD